jgi:soluble lytic murein transglycosylase-like protein
MAFSVGLQPRNNLSNFGQIIQAFLLLFSISLLFPATQAFAIMYGFLDAKGVCHFRCISERSRKKVITGGRWAYTRREPNGIDSIYDSYIQGAARTYRIDPFLIRAIIKVESSYNPNAVSSKGAQGLMQIQPDTARELHLDDPFNPKQNIIAGTKYFKQQMDSFGDIRLGLAAYNAGPSRVSMQGMLVYIPETQAYVAKVLQEYHQLASDKEK